MKKLVIDLDGTLTLDDEKDYAEKSVNLPLLAQLKRYKKRGFYIVIFTSRNMRTFKGDLAKVREFTAPKITAWLEKHGVPYDELIIGKPWCDEGFYVDDKAVRPSEFIAFSETKIRQILAKEKAANFSLNSAKNSSKNPAKSLNSAKNSSKIQNTKTARNSSKSLNSAKNSSKNQAKIHATKSVNLNAKNAKIPAKKAKK